MGWIDRLLGNDHERAARYEGRESASQSAARAAATATATAAPPAQHARAKPGKTGTARRTSAASGTGPPADPTP